MTAPVEERMVAVGWLPTAGPFPVVNLTCEAVPECIWIPSARL